jgi:hypothetical protein
MAAVIVTSTTHPDRVGGFGHPGPRRPTLEVLPGGRRGVRAHASAQQPARPVHVRVYHRRRLGVALAVVTFVAVGYLAVTGLQTVIAGTPTSRSSAPAAASTPGTTRAYVVQSGDTLWSIARTLRPHGEIRGLVDQLEARAGGATLVAGQRLRLDGLAD